VSREYTICKTRLLKKDCGRRHDARDAHAPRMPSLKLIATTMMPFRASALKNSSIERMDTKE
jgi:hypothetical protein